LAGCGSAATSTTSESPAPSSPVLTPFPVPAKRFSSAELGVSFLYPASWKLSLKISSEAAHMASVDVRSPVPSPGFLGVTVISRPLAKGTAPQPFSAATRSDLRHNLPLFTGGCTILRSELVRLDGLRLAKVEILGGSGGGDGRNTHGIYLISAMVPQASQLVIHFHAKRSAWNSVQGTLHAILDSMRFSPPQFAQR